MYSKYKMNKHVESLPKVDKSITFYARKQLLKAVAAFSTS